MKLSATARPVAVQELESELHQLRREQDYVAARKQYDQAAELGKRASKPRRPRLGARRGLGAGAGLRQCRGQGGTRGADRLAPDRHPGQRVDGGRARKAAALGTTAARAPGGTRQRRSVPWPMPCGCPAPACVKCSKPVATFLFLGPTGVGKTGARQGIGRIDLRR